MESVSFGSITPPRQSAAEDNLLSHIIPTITLPLGVEISDYLLPQQAQARTFVAQSEHSKPVEYLDYQFKYKGQEGVCECVEPSLNLDTSSLPDLEKLTKQFERWASLVEREARKYLQQLKVPRFSAKLQALRSAYNGLIQRLKEAQLSASIWQEVNAQKFRPILALDLSLRQEFSTDCGSEVVLTRDSKHFIAIVSQLDQKIENILQDFSYEKEDRVLKKFWENIREEMAILKELITGAQQKKRKIESQHQQLSAQRRQQDSFYKRIKSGCDNFFNGTVSYDKNAIIKLISEGCSLSLKTKLLRNQRLQGIAEEYCQQCAEWTDSDWKIIALAKENKRLKGEIVNSENKIDKKITKAVRSLQAQNIQETVSLRTLLSPSFCCTVPALNSQLLAPFNNGME